MTDKYHNKYRIASSRLQHWDYGWNGTYFITICTGDRAHYFGTIKNDEMVFSNIGKMAHQYWSEIPQHFSFIQLGAFVVMPNHVLGILIIDKMDGDEHINGDGDVETRQYLVSIMDTEQPMNTEQKSPPHKTPGQKRYQGKNTISSIVVAYKSVVSKHARHINPNYQWQSRFYDHIIKNERAYNNIDQYIRQNIARWKDDRFYE